MGQALRVETGRDLSSGGLAPPGQAGWLGVATLLVELLSSCVA